MNPIKRLQLASNLGYLLGSGQYERANDLVASAYPPGWPKCPVCGEPAMDGHITCGSAACNEGEQRREGLDQ